MAKELTSNVEVDGDWYGPDYPDNKVTQAVLDKITNPAAFAAPDELDSEANVDLRKLAAWSPDDADDEGSNTRRTRRTSE